MENTDQRRYKSGVIRNSAPKLLLQIRLRDDRHDILDDGDCCLHALHADMLIRTVEAVAAGTEVWTRKSHEG